MSSATQTTATAPSTRSDYEKAPEIVSELVRSYWMELETVQNYLAASTNPVGVRAEEIKKSLHEDVLEELGHARKLARRIHVLGGEVPGSMEFKPDQVGMQPPRDATNLVAIIDGAIEGETSAIEQYRKIIELCEGHDYVTQDLCIGLLADEEEHRRQFHGFRAEFARPGE